MIYLLYACLFMYIFNMCTDKRFNNNNNNNLITIFIMIIMS